MADIDWPSIVIAIRKRRFQDISPESWDMVADILENKKRGKGRPPDPKDSFFSSSVIRSIEKIQADGMTMVERWIWVEERYEQLRAQGMKSGEAQEQIAKEKNWTVKTVEASLTVIRAKHKADEELREALSHIELYDEDGNLLSDPNMMDYS